MKKVLLSCCLSLGFFNLAWAIEEPAFDVVKKYAQFEVRQYKSYLVAEVLVNDTAENAGNNAFEYLGGYIFGKNKGSKKIDMTAPVAQTPAPVKIEMTAPVSQTPAEGGFIVQFAMPKEFTLETLPEPINPKVKLREMPAQNYAVLTYSGSWSNTLYEEKLNVLKNAVKEVGLATDGEPIFARYNAPFSLPFLRRNEIWLRLKQ